VITRVDKMLLYALGVDNTHENYAAGLSLMEKVTRHIETGDIDGTPLAHPTVDLFISLHEVGAADLKDTLKNLGYL
jgi:hypothetical protein